jgi:hypothetical protein
MPDKIISHEKILVEAFEYPSDRSFGVVFSIVFALTSVFFYWNGNNFYQYSIVISVCLILSSFLFPKLLHPLNIVWFYFGKFLNTIMSPLMVGGIFFLFFLPMGILMKIFKKDPLHLNFNSEKSYWILRNEGIDSQSFLNQF